MSIALVAEFKVGGLTECQISLYSVQTILSMVLLGIWGHAPRKILKIFPSGIESGSSFEGKL